MTKKSGIDKKKWKYEKENERAMASYFSVWIFGRERVLCVCVCERVPSIVTNIILLIASLCELSYQKTENKTMTTTTTNIQCAAINLNYRRNGAMKTGDWGETEEQSRWFSIETS